MKNTQMTRKEKAFRASLKSYPCLPTGHEEVEKGAGCLGQHWGGVSRWRGCSLLTETLGNSHWVLGNMGEKQGNSPVVMSEGKMLRQKRRQNHEIQKFGMRWSKSKSKSFGFELLLSSWYLGDTSDTQRMITDDYIHKTKLSKQQRQK